MASLIFLTLIHRSNTIKKHIMEILKHMDFAHTKILLNMGLPRTSLMLMLEDGDHIVEPGEETEDDIDWESICP